MSVVRLDLTALPEKVRAIIYYSYAIVGLGIGATQVGFSAADVGQPVALTVALSVYAFLGTGLGLTAASNLPLRRKGEEYVPEHAALPVDPYE